MITMFDEDFQEKEVTEWTADDVFEWLTKLRAGELKHLAVRFLNRNVDGELLLVLKRRELQKNYRMKMTEIDIFTEELEKLVDYDEDYETVAYDDTP